MGAKTDGTASDTSSQASEADCAMPAGEMCMTAESGLCYSQPEIFSRIPLIRSPIITKWHLRRVVSGLEVLEHV
jgi:hypothetical protein